MHSSKTESQPKEAWPVVLLGDGRYFQLATGGTPSTDKPEYWENGTIPWLSSGEVHKKIIRFADGRITEKGFQYSNARFYPTHSILIALAGQGKTRGTAAITEIEVTSNQSIGAVIPNEELVEPYFVYYYLDSLYQALRSISAGAGRAGLNLSILAKVPINLPDKPVQERIAMVLSCIDLAIKETEALIVKQQHIKTGLMHELLTKGVDIHDNIRSEENNEFKDSELGRIPKEWDVVSLACISKLVTSGPRGWAKYYSREGTPFLRIGNLTREHIDLRLDNLIYVDPPQTSEGMRTSLEEDDVLISITADLGIIGVIPPDFGQAFVNQHIALLRLDKEKILPRWVGHYLSSYAGQSQFQKLNESGAKAGLNLPMINKLRVAQPKDKDEQQFISDAIDRCAGSINAEKRTLAKFRRLKRGLMQDLLSGDVSTERLTP
jgi:type I restriction enzyme S subunit